MSELDMSANLKVVISKLPFKLREQFRSTACDIYEKQKRKLNFNDMTHFRSSSCLTQFWGTFHPLKEECKSRGM